MMKQDKFKFAGAGRIPDEYQLNIRKRVFEQLERKDQSTSELAANAGLPIDHVRRALKFLEKSGMVQNCGRMKTENPGQPPIIWAVSINS